MTSISSNLSHYKSESLTAYDVNTYDFRECDRLGYQSPPDSRWANLKGEGWRLGLDFLGSQEKVVNFCKEKWASRLFRCSHSLKFLAGCFETGQIALRLQSARFCRVSVCPICNWRKMLKWRSKLTNAVNDILLNHPQWSCIFMTLTIRNCPLDQLGGTLDLMSSGWHRLQAIPEFSGGAIKGIFRSLEITRAKNGYVHPHYHCLIAVTPSYFRGNCYISQARLGEAWKKALKVDYKPVVDIRKCRSKDGNVGDLSDAILEVCKYMVKPTDLSQDIDWTLLLADQLFRRKRFTSLGIFRDYFSEHEDDYMDLVSIKENEFFELISDRSIRIFDWVERLGDYYEVHRLSEFENGLDVLCEAERNYQDSSAIIEVPDEVLGIP